MLQTDGKFYLGKDILENEAMLYAPEDLTTHAVVVGMTGSGKTGLCIDLLEEAALNNIPALMIDPKGDITNTLLHFPGLLPEDFKPWMNPDEARRAGKQIDQAAAEEADKWAKGLKQWGMGKERVQALKNSAQFAIYTPGSDVGIPVSILASLRAPEIPWEGNQESIREKIAGTVTALLGLVGVTDIDPVRSREHILLANIFENAWSQDVDLDLGELILQVQTPPFEKLGVMDLDTFFPKKSRFDLSMQLNNILAAPTFQNWISGQPLDIQSLLYDEDGRPKHSVFYIAHLSESERMFFVTLLYAAVETWMRAQAGTTSLRALIYFDEIYGYLPPVANPPSKSLMMRMLKQARAFGVGQILVTQNPADLDYKALSNAGSWFIGRLQTEKDRERLLDGLAGAAGGKFDKPTYNKLIAELNKRQFLLHNIHEAKPEVFQTRWAMNYLAGPMTRTQIPALNILAGAKLPASEAQPRGTSPAPRRGSAPTTTQDMDKIQSVTTEAIFAEEKPARGSATRPSLPTGVHEYFLPHTMTVTEAFKAAGQSIPQNAIQQGMLYRPVLLAQASIRYFQRKYNLDQEQSNTAIVADPDPRGVVRWENHLAQTAFDPRDLDTTEPVNARYGTLEAPFNDDKIIKGLESDFVDWIYRRSSVIVHANEKLKMYAGPDVSEGEFRKTVSNQARQDRDAEIKKVELGFQKKLDTLRRRLEREMRELEEGESEHAQRRMEELGTHFENLFTSSRHRRRVSSSIQKHRMTSQAKADIEESQEEIKLIEREMEALSEEMDMAVDEVENKWSEIASQIDEIPVTPLKKDILVEIYGVAWMPYHLIEVDGKLMELPGFGA